MASVGDVLSLHARLKAIHEEARALGLSSGTFIMRIPRPVFDALPGATNHFGKSEGCERDFWVKGDFLTYEPPASSGLTAERALAESGVA